ncbi:ankyrin repeat domain-containing protein [Candidatus Berkiella aquae]|uniref:Ankyrin repeat domain-containing protein n=1 Tax=Candidatus Berkiella aquae TaxID=295108 RepID=A0A0Q9YVI9_9GAMM|nr:ankyrin repeat domain-containing protein [Candidatus Berkiella aquae]MCS5711371.1 ankyrin repeat domain-containing protein [Candidatus Berkiella aquae]
MTSGAQRLQNTQQFCKLIKNPRSNKNTLALIDLIRQGIYINSQNLFKFTPLHMAAKYGSSRVVQLLLDNRAKIDMQNRLNETPLHEAVNYGRIRIIELLLKRGAKIDKKDLVDYTPLKFATCHTRFNNNPDIFKKFLLLVINSIANGQRLELLCGALGAGYESLQTAAEITDKIVACTDKDEKLKIVEVQYGQTQLFKPSLITHLLNLLDPHEACVDDDSFIEVPKQTAITSHNMMIPTPRSTTTQTIASPMRMPTCRRLTY